MKKVIVLLGLDLLLAALVTSLWWSGKIPPLRELSSTLSTSYPRWAGQAWVNINLAPSVVKSAVQGVLGLLKLPPLPATPTATPSARLPEVNFREENERLAQELIRAQEKIGQLQEQLKYYQDRSLKITHPTYNYTGEDLFAGVNKYRRENGLGELSKDYNLCYFASYRLNQLLELGKLDNHQGFDEFKPADKFKYGLVGENLAQGYPTADDVVSKGWVGSPGHHLLLSDPRLTLGCTASNRGFSVLIAGREN